MSKIKAAEKLEKIQSYTKGPSKESQQVLFTRDNYMLMLLGLVLLAIGFFLMAGGKSADPKVFKPEEVYSNTRITIAPILIMAGFVIEIFAIMKKPKSV